MDSTKLSNFLVSLTFGCVIAFIFQKYIFLPYFGPNTNTFMGSAQQAVFGSLNKEINFSEKNSLTAPISTTIETAWGSLCFSSQGAALELLDIKRDHHGHAKFIRTVSLLESFAVESKSFLLLFEEETPLHYVLENNIDEDDSHVLIYSAKIGNAEVKKVFIIDKTNPVIKLKIELNDKGHNRSWQPRIIVKSPRLGSVLDEEIISSIVINTQGTFSKKVMEKVDADQGWIKPQLFGLDDRYFVHALIKDNGLLQKAYYTMFAPKQYSMVLQSAPQKGSFLWEAVFFVGPKDLDVVRAVDSRLESTIDYAGWFEHLAKGLLWILKKLFSILGNYGYAIIMLTFLLKILMLPLTLTSEAKMKEQKEMQKKLSYIQQRYKDNPEALTRERNELIRKYGVKAMGLGGCLPLFVQAPFFIALSRLLNSSFELYQAPMLWIPDLSARDPWYILPVIIVLSMLASALNADDKQKLSIIAMALFFGALTANFAAGLALYIAVNTLIGVMQTNITYYFFRR